MDKIDNEIIDSQNDESDQTDDLDLDNTDGQDDPDVEALKEKNKQLYARAKKAEEELKAIKKPKDEPVKQDAPKPEPPKVDVEALVNEKLEQRDLESLDVPEDLKPEIQKIAKLQGVSVRKAALDPYILHRKQEIERQAKADDAAITRTKKGTQVKFDPNSPPDVDMSTEEGRKQWSEYKKFLASQK